MSLVPLSTLEWDIHYMIPIGVLRGQFAACSLQFPVRSLQPAVSSLQPAVSSFQFPVSSFQFAFYTPAHKKLSLKSWHKKKEAIEYRYSMASYCIRTASWLDEYILQNEEQCKNHHYRCHLVSLSADQVQEYVWDHTYEDTVRDWVGQRHHDDADECRDRLWEVIERNS